MSESIPLQWISQYIINIAETCGKSFNDIPIEAISPRKKKRVQILEFLTYNSDAEIWGRVSDKEYSIPVCFTKDAVLQYMKDLQGRRLTEAKHAIFFIGQFRPIFVRIPVGNNRSNLSEEPHIALEAGVVKFVGSGLGVFGSPQDVEMNSRVKAWVRGLRRGGDGGDVLKRADSQRQEICPAINHVEVPPILQAREPECNPSCIVPERPVSRNDLMREHRKRWERFEKDIWTSTMKPRIVSKVQMPAGEQPQMGQLVEECVPPETVIDVVRSQPCTPPRTSTPERDINEQTTPRISEWPSSAPGSPTGVLPSPAHDGDNKLPTDCVNAEASAEENGSIHEPSTPPTTSPLRPPTPAQRIRQIVLPPSPSDSSPIPVPPSSFPMPIRRNIKRRVPYPGVPLLPADHSGSTQILVPNSDSSGTQSQSQSQPQSEPSSQLHSQSQSHRPPFPSQLTQEFKPGPTSTPAAKQSDTGTDRGTSPMLPCDQLESHWGGDHASSPGVINWDVHEGLGHGSHQPSDTNPDAHQIPKQSTAEDPDMMAVDAVASVEIPAVGHASPSQAPEDLLDKHKHIKDNSPQPSNLSMHSLFSGSPSLSLSPPEVIPSITTRITSPPLGEPTSRAPSHDVEAWKAPSFMNSRKGKGKAIEMLDKTSETHKRRRASPTSSSPLASHKRRKFVTDETLESGLAISVNTNERARSTVPNGKRNHAVTLDVTESHTESPSIKQSSARRTSKDPSQVLDASLSQNINKKRRIRLKGYQVDFENIPAKAESSGPLMTMGYLRTNLLRTGRIRTLGDEVTRDGSIYIRSD